MLSFGLPPSPIRNAVYSLHSKVFIPLGLGQWWTMFAGSYRTNQVVRARYIYLGSGKVETVPLIEGTPAFRNPIASEFQYKLIVDMGGVYLQYFLAYQCRRTDLGGRLREVDLQTANYQIDRQFAENQAPPLMFTTKTTYQCPI